MTKKILSDLDATGRTITATTFSGNASTATSIVATPTNTQLLVQTGTNTTGLLTAGTTNYVLTQGATGPTWAAASGGSGNAFTAIYTTNGTINNSFPSSSTAISVFGGNTTPTLGYTVAVDNTYEFEFSGRLSLAGATTTQTPTFSIGSTTVTLSPSVGVVGQISYSTNTSAITSQAAVNSAYFTSTAALTAVTSSRFYTIFAKGIIRVTGTGTVKIYPALSATTSVDNVWVWGTGTTFKLTALGNGSVTTVGTWA